MPKKLKKTESKKQTEEVRRIYNPVTGSYYTIKERSSAYLGAGQIKGLWSKK